ncbi:MAG: hypothetical protein IMX00_10770 [Limnochordales bacterium]|nr:hypothetical protein [Limnochordales bacterium]
MRSAVISLAHGLTGAALGVMLRHPAAALLAGVISHIPLDETPHRDYRTALAAIVDLVATAAVLAMACIYLHRRQRAELVLPLLLGAVGGILPDLEVAIGYFYHQRLFFPTHTGLLPHPQLQSGNLGIWTQVVVILLDLLCLGVATAAPR